MGILKKIWHKGGKGLGSLVASIFLLGNSYHLNANQEIINTRIAMVTQQKGNEKNFEVWLMNPSNQKMNKIADTSRERVRFSPNGEYISFVGKDHTLQIVDPNGSILHRFGVRFGVSFDGSGGSVPCVEMIYGDKNFDYYVRNDELSKTFAREFSWSPDSKYVYCDHYDDRIYRYDLKNKTLEGILWSRSKTFDHNPVMSPDNRSLVYLHHEYGNMCYIYKFLVDENYRKGYSTHTAGMAHDELVHIIAGTLHDENLNVQWIDNENIVCCSTTEGNHRGRIYRFNINKKEGTEFDMRNQFLGNISLSPDKRMLAMYCGSTIYLIEPSKITTAPVTRPPLTLEQIRTHNYLVIPTIRIEPYQVLSTKESSRETTPWVSDMSSSTSSIDDITCIAWSPNAKHLAVSGRDYEGPGYGRIEIYKIAGMREIDLCYGIKKKRTSGIVIQMLLNNDFNKKYENIFDIDWSKE